MRYELQELAGIVGGHWVGNDEQRTWVVEQILFDSRRIVHPSRSVFVALEGERADGHAYIGACYEGGVRCFLVRRIPVEPLPDAVFVVVSDTLRALQQLAAYHRGRYGHLQVVGITGSNGKTIVKEWLNQLLERDFHIVRSPKSYNSQIGVPLSVLQIEETHTLGIFEAGISAKGEMAHLASMIRCQVGILTNVGDAHSEGFASRSEKTAEKLKLFADADVLICCTDADERIQACVPSSLRIFGWSLRAHPQARVHIYIVRSTEQSTQFEVQFKGVVEQFEVSFTDEGYLQNAFHCVSFMLYMGYALPIVRERIAHLTSISLRLELKDGVNNCVLINDSYSSDLNSLRIALDFMAQKSGGRTRTLILSDILETGKQPAPLYEEVASLLSQHRIQRVVGIGNSVAQLQQYLPSSVRWSYFPDTLQFIQHTHTGQFQHETILLKGARRFEFERISRLLEKKAHKTVLEINLTALIQNLHTFARLLQPTTKIMVMVKASAYGSGSHEIASLLEYRQIDYLAVAYADEGIELRHAGIRTPIMVLNPEEAAFDACIRYQLEPEVYSLTQLQHFIQAAQKRPTNNPYPIHIKLDTGMHRLGFEPNDLPILIQTLTQVQPLLRVASIFSHLAASDDPAHDLFTHTQCARFSQMANHITTHLPYRPLLHILNSSGIARFPQYQFDMVRLGIGLYGIQTNPASLPLQVVSTLKATISQIKKIAPGESVGYSRKAIVNQPTTIATISIGYADGYPRTLGNGRSYVLVNGHPAPTIGNVCMDMTMINITHIPHVNEGDEVILFGSEKPIQQLADELNTIPYEILTNISSRVKRIYYEE